MYKLVFSVESIIIWNISILKMNSNKGFRVENVQNCKIIKVGLFDIKIEFKNTEETVLLRNKRRKISLGGYGFSFRQGFVFMDFNQFMSLLITYLKFLYMARKTLFFLNLSLLIHKLSFKHSCCKILHHRRNKTKRFK